MKQLVIAFLKCLSFLFLFRTLQTIVFSSYAFTLGDNEHLIFILIDAGISLFIFYALFFKTDSLISLFKIKWESTESVAYPTVLKSGIFLIGFYFFASMIGVVLSDVFLYVKQELSSVGGGSFDRFSTFISPVSADSILPKLLTSAIGFLIAMNAGRMTNYFIKKEDESKEVQKLD